VQSANSGIESITTLIESAKSIGQAALATSDAAARTKYMTQYNEVLSQIDNMASDSGYRGTNLLGGNMLTVQFNEDGRARWTWTDLMPRRRACIADAAGWQMRQQGAAAINTSLGQLTDALSTLRGEASSLSSSLAIIQTRSDWADQMIATFEGGGERIDGCRHERRECEPAHAANPAIPCHNGAEHLDTVGADGPGALLRNTPVNGW